MREGDAAARRWMQESADQVVANVQYLELPSLGLVRLVAPVWVDGRLEAAISLLSRPAELSARDRCALVASARAMAQTSAQARVDMPLTLPHRAACVRGDGCCARRGVGPRSPRRRHSPRRRPEPRGHSTSVATTSVPGSRMSLSISGPAAASTAGTVRSPTSVGPLTIERHAMSRRGTAATTSHRDRWCRQPRRRSWAIVCLGQGR